MIFPLYRVGPFRVKRGGPAFLSPRLVLAIWDEIALVVDKKKKYDIIFMRETMIILFKTQKEGV